MTTKAEFVKWLNQFPDEAIIECIITRENNYGYEVSPSIYEVEFIIEEIDPVTMFGYYDGSTFELEANYNHKTGISEVKTIRIGKKD